MLLKKNGKLSIEYHLIFNKIKMENLTNIENNHLNMILNIKYKFDYIYNIEYKLINDKLNIYQIKCYVKNEYYFITQKMFIELSNYFIINNINYFLIGVCIKENYIYYKINFLN